MTPRDEIEAERAAFAEYITSQEHIGFDAVVWRGVGGDPLGVVCEPQYSENSLRSEWAAWLARSALSRPAAPVACPTCDSHTRVAVQPACASMPDGWHDATPATEAKCPSAGASEGEDWNEAVDACVAKCRERAESAQKAIDALAPDAYEGGRFSLVHNRNTSQILGAILEGLKRPTPPPAEVEASLATLTRERDEAVKDLTDVRWAFKCSVDAHEATRADLASARTALAEARALLKDVRGAVVHARSLDGGKCMAWCHRCRIDALVEPAP